MRCAILFLASLLFIPANSLAISGTTHFVGKKQQAAMIPGWPEGALKLINDPLRADGWHPWFSECPNDRYYFGLEVHTPADINHLVEILAAIKAEKVELHLMPGEGG